MSAEDAITWLRQVDGQLYRSNPHPSGNRAWVAVVRTPPEGASRPKLIVALGSTMEEAARAAESQWQQHWAGLGPTH